MDYEFERQASMADWSREAAHLHLVTEARAGKPSDDMSPGIQEGSSKLSSRAAFFQVMNMFSALGLVVSPDVKIQH
jgi:hypothetical protein